MLPQARVFVFACVLCALCVCVVDAKGKKLANFAARRSQGNVITLSDL